MTPYTTYVPYCGLPPLPGEIWLRWNLDPLLIGVLMAVALLYEAGLRRELRGNPQAAASSLSAARRFYVGWFLTVVALVSPLCSVSVSLFSARVAQHMLLLLVAAPLVVLGRPGLILRALREHPIRSRLVQRMVGALGSVGFAWIAFATSLWFWHIPAAYGATFLSDGMWWAMHASLFASALLLWRALLPRPGDTHALARVLAGFTTLLHMGLLGALITFAPDLLYWPHVLTTQVWGLTPLEDQQLGGLIMWVPGAGGFLAAALTTIALALRPPASQ